MQLDTSDAKLNYDDVSIMPERMTSVQSRSECNPYDEDRYLPVFASCMTSVVSMENTTEFNAAKIRTVIPRSYSMQDRIDYLVSSNPVNFTAFSLAEADEAFGRTGSLYYGILKNILKSDPLRKFNICIDLANGHMRKLLDTVRRIKGVWGDSAVIMTGNIANPETYEEYEKAGVDYCRVGIAGGGACLTGSNTGVYTPYFSLIREIYGVKKRIGGKCKIIADGNIRGYRDIQKALLFADYVMIGGLFNKAMESAGKTVYGARYWNFRGMKIMRPISTLLTYGREIPREKYGEAFSDFKSGRLSILKQFYGQSTKLAQKLTGMANGDSGIRAKTSEGLVKYQEVEYSIAGWAENETDYLRSAMSYTDSRTLDEYKDSPWVKITGIRYNR